MIASPDEQDRPSFKWHYAGHSCSLCGKYGDWEYVWAPGYHSLLLVYPVRGGVMEFCNSCLELLGSKAVKAPEEKDTP